MVFGHRISVTRATRSLPGSRFRLRAVSTDLCRKDPHHDEPNVNTWHEANYGRLGFEVEGWPRSQTAKRKSGHQKVRIHELQAVIDEARSRSNNSLVQNESSCFSARLRGLLKVALVRPDMMFADEVLGFFGRIRSRFGISLSHDELFTFVEPILQRALRLECPSEEEVVHTLQARCCRQPEGETDSMSRLATQLLPRWVQSAKAEGVYRERLRKAAECWELSGEVNDIEGVGLFAAICLQLQEPWRVREAIEGLLARGVNLRLCYQPLFLQALLEQNLIWKEHVNAPAASVPALVQQAAEIARRGESHGVNLRRHGALLMAPMYGREEANEYEVIASGFNHAASPLGPRALDTPAAAVRTFTSAAEGACKHQHVRLAQRHAEIHCLLQLERLESARGLQLLIVELADVGPGLKWAEPCSRGCKQFLMKYGVTRVHFTDGQGGLSQQVLEHKPELDVPALTFASASRLKDDAISERACLDMEEKLRREAQGCLDYDFDAFVASGVLASAEARAFEPLNLRGSMLPLPKRRGSCRSNNKTSSQHMRKT